MRRCGFSSPSSLSSAFIICLCFEAICSLCFPSRGAPVSLFTFVSPSCHHTSVTRLSLSAWFSRTRIIRIFRSQTPMEQPYMINYAKRDSIDLPKTTYLVLFLQPPTRNTFSTDALLDLPHVRKETKTNQPRGELMGVGPTPSWRCCH